ncbi:hypothetical protein [Acinetobacter piscicola]|uniref:hypothetical protein n=1 Tax=Acinetobacter piscicola TaxID=2006115 RepID=UPI001021DC72|nr:hypothetical protein [Acinetobacter piscicola]RYL28418.1 hypothetical protein EWP19_03525 [Acinetobacter piscicola]
MPIKTVETWLHLTTQKNQQVMRNVARLWNIGEKARAPQEILDALHPWGECKDLYFHNFIAHLFIILGVFILIFGWMIDVYIPFALTFLVAMLCLFFAYLIYEPRSPIEEVMQFLEKRMLMLKYDLQFNRVPSFLPQSSNSLLVMSKLKQSFPLFSKGNAINEITQYIATTWEFEHKKYPVLLFHYYYINELPMSQFNKDQNKKQGIRKDQWGAFVFATPRLGFAASNQRHAFFEPYTQKWSTSDILVNENLNIFGHDQNQLARHISPMMTLKLSDFFQDYSGEVVFHFEEDMLCYMGDQNLLQHRQNIEKIRDVSQLRGHLRTLRMAEYERFQQHMLNLIS